MAAARKCASLLGSLLLCAGIAAAQTGPAEAPRQINDVHAVAAEFGSWMEEIERSGQVAGLAASIVSGDEVVLERGIGYADWNEHKPVTPETVFRVASLSKAFAATMAGVLVEEGALRWDLPVTTEMPTFTLADESASERLTVRDILSHRVGLPRNTHDLLLEQAEPYPLLVERLKEVPMTCPVGECYGYQNIAFSLIGDIIYARTGNFFHRLVEKRLFHPLGMDTATYGLAELQSASSWARPHVRARGGGFRSFIPNENYYRVAPAAGANASLRDLQKWLMAQMGNHPDVLSPELLAELHRPQVKTAREMQTSPWRRERLLAAEYALGWRVYDYAGQNLIFHAGAVQGYRALIGFLPEHEVGLVMMWNSETAIPVGLLPMFLDRVLGLPDVDWANIEKLKGQSLAGGSQ